jgi:hypothetical protein
MNQHEAAAAQVACRRMYHGQREACRYRGVDSVSTLLQDFDAGIRGQMVDADDHGMLHPDRLLVGRGDCVIFRVVGRGVLGVQEGSCGETDGEDEGEGVS